MPHYRTGFGETNQQSNLDRLRAYDAAANSDARTSAVADRQDLAERKFAFDKAHKEAELELRAKGLEDRIKVNDDLDKVRQQREGLREDLAKRADLLKQTEAAAKEKATLARINAAQQFYDGVSKLNPQSHDFQAGYATLMKNLEPTLIDSQAKLPEGVAKVSDHLFQQNATWMAANGNPTVNPTFALQDALAATQPIYGVADASGKNFNATKAGDGSVQTHVQASYLPPGAKNPVTQVFPIDVFNSAVGASQLRNQAPGTNSAVGVATGYNRAGTTSNASPPTGATPTAGATATTNAPPTADDYIKGLLGK